MAGLTSSGVCCLQAEVGQYVALPTTTSTTLQLPGSPANISDWTIRVRSEITGEQLATPFPLSAVRYPSVF